LPALQDYKVLNGIRPSFLAKHFGNVIGTGQMEELIRRFRRLKKVGIKAADQYDSRSSIPALHLGIWRRSSSDPFITRDTRMGKSGAQVEAMNGFLHAIQDYVAPKIARFTQMHDPDQWALQQRYWPMIFINSFYLSFQRVRNYLENKTGLFDENPNLDFHGAFTTVAVKEGVSEKVHVDHNDGGITWIIPVGEWEGAQLQLPQLGCGINLSPGDALGFQGRFLAHYNTPISSGTRLVLTCFTCRNVVTSACQ
jgi:hypothetical protein